MLGDWGIGEDSAAGRRQFAAEMEARRLNQPAAEFKAVRRGWCLGGKGFRRDLLAQISEQRREWHYGPELIESEEEKAQRLVEAALQKKGWTEDDLAGQRKGHPFKLALAVKLRARTTVTEAPC